MIARLIWKLIVALSLFLALTLLLLWSRTRQTDLLISGASGGSYRELRMGKGQLGVTLVTTWPEDEHVQWGRARHPVPTDPTEPPLTQPPPALESLTLFDGAVVTLDPGPASRWPPTRTSGLARMREVSIKHTMRPKSTPTTTALTDEPFEQAQQGSDWTFQGRKWTYAGRTRSRRGSSDPTLIVSYTYERFSLPIWAAAGIVLVPIWFASLIALLRGFKRRSRRKRGLCERCGYDLRGNPGGIACPECGAATSAIPAPPSGEQLMARLR